MYFTTRTYMTNVYFTVRSPMTANTSCQVIWLTSFGFKLSISSLHASCLDWRLSALFRDEFMDIYRSWWCCLMRSYMTKTALPGISCLSVLGRVALWRARPVSPCISGQFSPYKLLVISPCFHGWWDTHRSDIDWTSIMKQKQWAQTEIRRCQMMSQ